MFDINITFLGACLTFPGCTGYCVSDTEATIDYEGRLDAPGDPIPAAWLDAIELDRSDRVTKVDLTVHNVRLHRMPKVDDEVDKVEPPQSLID